MTGTEKTKDEVRFVAVEVPQTYVQGLQDNGTGKITTDIFEIMAQIRNDLHLLRKNVG